ncbi:hypothetical protein M407DRAFT_167230 [Tulasnella calospora MUT 4182]|uniref:Uncharacterized protein n=1 Tax=Tulasnella calospora MUT 4182 TaxID=1051891 RepID=A0A0C3M7B2_9AGAM|nr:hypothetical protein M407DRAFT_167230 [Tulasnella calospora MUT 4182]
MFILHMPWWPSFRSSCSMVTHACLDSYVILYTWNFFLNPRCKIRGFGSGSQVLGACHGRKKS